MYLHCIISVQCERLDTRIRLSHCRGAYLVVMLFFFHNVKMYGLNT